MLYQACQSLLRVYPSGNGDLDLTGVAGGGGMGITSVDALHLAAVGLLGNAIAWEVFLCFGTEREGPISFPVLVPQFLFLQSAIGHNRQMLSLEFFSYGRIYDDMSSGPAYPSLGVRYMGKLPFPNQQFGINIF